MSTQTTNLHLVKPSDNERASNDVINANMDTIDAAVGNVDVAPDGRLQSQVTSLKKYVSKKVSFSAGMNTYFAAGEYSQHALLWMTVKNSSSPRYGHEIALVLTDTGITLWDGTAGQEVFNLHN